MRVGTALDLADRYVRRTLASNPKEAEQLLEEYAAKLAAFPWESRRDVAPSGDDLGGVPSWWQGDEEAARSSMAAAQSLRR